MLFRNVVDTSAVNAAPRQLPFVDFLAVEPMSTPVTELMRNSFLVFQNPCSGNHRRFVEGESRSHVEMFEQGSRHLPVAGSVPGSLRHLCPDPPAGGGPRHRLAVDGVQAASDGFPRSPSTLCRRSSASQRSAQPRIFAARSPSARICRDIGNAWNSANRGSARGSSGGLVGVAFGR